VRAAGYYRGSSVGEQTAGVRSTVARCGVLLALALVAWWFLDRYAVRHDFFDLQVYDGAVRYWLRDHGQIYDYLKPYSVYGFTYPPFGALTMAPMAYLPWDLVTTLATVGTVLASLLLLVWFLSPLVARQGWTRWFVVGVAAALAAVFEPLRETVLFGQVNLLLVALVTADFLFGVRRGRRFGGIGIGLAAAVKLTPAIFIGYLLLARRWRAAAVATGTAALATVFATAVAPNASRVFWTEALWDTNRVGNLASVANQSLRGTAGRLDPVHTSTALWLVLVLATLGFWVWRCLRCVRAGDEVGGFALTAVVGCLVSPVTWVHHLVWLLPALLLLVDRGFAARGWRRPALLLLSASLYVLLSSRLVWYYGPGTRWNVFLGGNAYVLASVALLALLPTSGARPAPGDPIPVGRARPDAAHPAGEESAVPDVAELGHLGGAVGAVGEPLDAPGTVGHEPGPLVEAARPVVVGEYP
jgi:alpha-1,2-mannosyltransferase